MDENYLDNLLNEFSLDKEIDNKIEDELDNQIAKEREQYRKAKSKSREDLFNLDLEQDVAGGLLEQDMLFSEEQMDELDNLDELADLDMGDLDFSDIDLDDLDMTRLDDIDTSDIDDLLKDFEGDLEIDEAFHEEDGKQEESSGDNVVLEDNLNEDSFDADEFLDSLLEETAEKNAEQSPIVELEDKEEASADIPKQDSETASDENTGDLDDLLDSLSADKGSTYDAMDAMDGFSGFGQIEENQDEPMEALSDEELSSGDEAALDDLFSLLDLDEEEAGGEKSISEDNDGTSLDLTGLEEIDELKDLEDISAKEDNEPLTKADKKKKSFMEILFGEADEDDELSPEELAAIEAKKAEKKRKKQEAKEARKEKAEAAKALKEEKNGKKKKADAEKQRVKAEKKAKRKAEELANAEPEKKLNKPAVFFIFSLFLGGTALFYLATNNFNYTQAIQKATNYFENRKYHKAYDEIRGVEVKEKDQDLKDRIYTVMYVERLYESYNNNIKLGFYDKALDSLLRGVDKYYEHYDEAVELGIVDDIDYSFGRIQDSLLSGFGISLEKALEINKLENDEYVLTIRSYVEANSEKLEKYTNDSNETKEETSGREDAIAPEDADVSGKQEEEVTQ